MRLTERYMDPPGQAMPDCLIAARLANHMEAAFRAAGDDATADKFKGFDWQTEEDAFMDGYHQNASGRRVRDLRAPPGDGHERLPGARDRLREWPDRRHQAAVRGRQVLDRGRQGAFHADRLARPAGARQGPGEAEVPVPDQQRADQPRLAVGLSGPEERAGDGPLAVSIHPDAPRRHGRDRGAGRATWSRCTTTNGATQAMVYPTPTAKPKETFMLFAYPKGVQGNVVSAGVNEFIIPNYKQTWANIRKLADAPAVVAAPLLQVAGIPTRLTCGSRVTTPRARPTPPRRHQAVTARSLEMSK